MLAGCVDRDFRWYEYLAMDTHWHLTQMTVKINGIQWMINTPAKFCDRFLWSKQRYLRRNVAAQSTYSIMTYIGNWNSFVLGHKLICAVYRLIAAITKTRIIRWTVHTRQCRLTRVTSFGLFENAIEWIALFSHNLHNMDSIPYSPLPRCLFQHQWKAHRMVESNLDS